MATITKTIGAAGDYTTPASAASAFNAGTVSGASASDDIVFNIIDNAAFDSVFQITANPTSYASVTLKADASVRHTGLAGTGARISISTNVEYAVGSTVAALNCTYEWLEIRATGAGVIGTGISITSFSSGKMTTVRNCILHDNGLPAGGSAAFRACAIGGLPGAANGSFSGSARIHNTVIYTWRSGSTIEACGIGIPGGGVRDVQVINCTVDGIDVTGGTAGNVAGIRVANTSTHVVKNCVVTNIGSNTTTGTRTNYTTSVSSATCSNNASADTSAPGTSAQTSINRTNTFNDPTNGDFRPLNDSVVIFATGVDLATTPTGVNVDLTGRDRDSQGDTWSMGPYQVSIGGSVSPVITISTPTPYMIRQRVAGVANFTVTGTYGGTGSPTTVEARANSGTWSTLDAAPSAGSYTGTLSVPAGTNTVSVRWSNDTGVTATVSNILVGDVYLDAGQSNNEGRLTNLQSYSHATHKAALFDQNDITWRELADPSDPDTSKGSIWPLLATLIMADQGVPVGFITTADGGTSLIGDWKPTVTTGAKYNAAVTRLSTSGVNAIKAMIWDQGETDAADGVAKATYNTALDALAANIQTSTSKTFPTICDLVGNGVSGLDPIRQAQIEAWDDNADIYPGANSLTRAGLHWETNAEGATHAALLWVALDEALYGGPSGRGPRLVSAITISGTSTLVLTFDRDLLASDSTYTSTAFTVSHSGTARTVSSVTRTGTRTVQLTLSGALDGSTPTVTFGSSQTAAGATVPRTTAISLPATIHSISSISVPAEPIYAAAVTVNAPDTTAPVIAAASVNSAGTTLTVSFTEVDSPPLLPSSAATGITLSSTGASVTVSNGTRQSDLVFTFPLSRTIYNNETLLVSYTQASGNITDSAVPSVNEVPTTSNFAATNNSTQTPTITSVSTDAIVLVGTAATITWSSAGIIGNVDILLSTDGGSTFPITIVSGTANDGSYSWTPEAAQITATGVLRVRSSSNNSYQGTRSVIVATTSGGVGGSSGLWFRLQELAVNDGLELSRP